MKEKQGNLSRVGLPKLLHLIYKKGDEAAVLDIVREPIKKRFYFKKGIPVFATSNILSEVLGRLLLRESVISQRDYERSLEMVLSNKKKHGEVLVSMGLVTPQKLDSFLSLQVKRRLLKIFRWNEGAYRYIKTDSIPGNIGSYPLHPASLILEGISLGFYPETRLRADLKEYLDKPLTRGEAPYDLDDFGLNLQEKRFLDSFNGQKTLREVLVSSDLLRQRALSLALGFIITGVLKTEGQAEEQFLEEAQEMITTEAAGDARLNAELVFIKAKTAITEGDYAGAIKELKAAADLNPVEGEYWAYLGWATYRQDPSRFKEAEKLIKDALDLNNDLDSAWYFLGRIFLAEGDLDWAERAFKTALQKNPWTAEAMCELKKLEIKKEAPAPDASYKEALEGIGIKADPFCPAPYEGFVLLESQNGIKEEVLKAIDKEDPGVILLEGPEGSGKTTIALEALRSLSGDKLLCSFILKPQDKEFLLVKAINEELGAAAGAATTKDQLLSLGMKVSQNRVQGGHTLVIIDNAHLLSHGCFRLVQYLSRIKTIQMMLIAEPSIDGVLGSAEFSELNGKIAVRIKAPSLSEEEALGYVQRRLLTAGAHVSVLGEGTIKNIFNEAKGLPKRINELAAKALFEPPAPQPAKLEETPVAVPAFSEEMPQAASEIETDLSSFDLDLSGEKARAETPQKNTFTFESGEEEPNPETDLEPEPPQAATHGQIRQMKAPAPQHIHMPSMTPPAPVKKKSIRRLVLWVIVMLVAGLIAGTVIGYFFFGAFMSASTVVEPQGINSDIRPSSPPANNNMEQGTVQGSAAVN